MTIYIISRNRGIYPCHRSSGSYLSDDDKPNTISMFHVKHSTKKGKVQNMNENKNKTKEEKKEIREDVKNFNEYGTINPVKEEETQEEQEEVSHEELVEFSDIDHINKAISLIGNVVTESEDEELVYMLENATHILVSATDYLSRKENNENE